MYNILIDELPKSVKVGERIYPINWGYRANMLIEIEMFSDRSDEQKLLDALNIFYFQNIPADMEEALNQLVWFFQCGKVNRNGKRQGKSQRSYDFETDSAYIYAAFRTQYNINLNATPNEQLHWWEFCAMFDSLNEELKISRIMYCRTADLEGMSKNQKNFIKKMRSIYAISGGNFDHKTRLAKRNADMLTYVRRRLDECRKKE